MGGGYNDHRLADHAFTWLREKAEQCDLTFDHGYLSLHIKGDPKGKNHDSMKFIFKLLDGFRGGFIRPIGVKLNEAVHPGVLTKREDPGSDYHPQNLETYLASAEFKRADVESDADENGGE